MGGRFMKFFMFKMDDICPYQIKEDEMSGTCGMTRRDEKYKFEG
jgi:hypothetical protein